MKRVGLFLVALLGVVAVSNAQEKKQVEVSTEGTAYNMKIDDIFVYANKKPITFEEYVVDNLEYPQSMIDNMEEGEAIIQFVIEPNGNVTDIKMVNSLSEDCDHALIELMQGTSGMWKPAIEDGQFVATEKEISIVFDLKEFNSKAYAIRKFNKGVDKYNDGKVEAAIRLYDEAMKYMPNHAGLVYMRGCANYDQGNYELAMKDFKRVKKLNCTLADHYITELQAMRRSSK